VKEWKKLGVALRIRDLEAVETEVDSVAASGK
jgi:hypothetical protein